MNILRRKSPIHNSSQNKTKQNNNKKNFVNKISVAQQNPMN